MLSGAPKTDLAVPGAGAGASAGAPPVIFVSPLAPPLAPPPAPNAAGALLEASKAFSNGVCFDVTAGIGAATSSSMLAATFFDLRREGSPPTLGMLMLLMLGSSGRLGPARPPCRLGEIAGEVGAGGKTAGAGVDGVVVTLGPSAGAVEEEAGAGAGAGAGTVMSTDSGAGTGATSSEAGAISVAGAASVVTGTSSVAGAPDGTDASDGTTLVSLKLADADAACKEASGWASTPSLALLLLLFAPRDPIERNLEELLGVNVFSRACNRLLRDGEDGGGRSIAFNRTAPGEGAGWPAGPARPTDLR